LSVIQSHLRVEGFIIESHQTQNVQRRESISIMDKAQSITLIKEIQDGKFDRNEIDVPRGNTAEVFWNDPMFSYGMEYGAILAIMKIFDINKKDLSV